MGKDISRTELIDELEQAIKSETLAIFAGAGLSKPAGFFDWKGLLKEPAKQIQLDIDKEHDLLNVAQYFGNSKGRSKIENVIVDSFSSHTSPTENHFLLASLPINTYWTTNYDDLIEKSLDAVYKKSFAMTKDDQLKLQIRDLDAVIYKMHGDYRTPSEAVITRNDYEEYGINKRMFFREVLEGDLLKKTFLFLGFGFSDPNFNFVLSKMRILLKGNTRPHYCIMRRPVEPERPPKPKDQNDEDYRRKEEAYKKEETDYNYEVIKQELFIDDLFKSGIMVHLIDNYDEITQILKLLSKRYKQKTVFISGSAHEYNPLPKDEATSFIRILSNLLVSRGYSIVNGYGLGVGTHVINGVAEYAYSNRNIGVGDRLTLMPFPQTAINNEILKETWSSYRSEMIKKCGISIFMFGNKDKDGETIMADGMEEEFEIAKKNESVLIPLDFTGSMAKKLSLKEGVKNTGIEFSDAKTTAEEVFKFIEKINQEEN